MAEEVVVGASPVPSNHKRKLEDLEPEAPGHTEQSAEQQNHLSAELDADKKAGEEVDGDFPEEKRPRLDEEKPDGLASDNGSKEGLTDEHAEDTGEPGIPNEKPQDDVQPPSEEIPKANDNEEPPTEDDKEITDTQQASIEDLKSENLEEPSFGVIEKPSSEEPSIGVTAEPSIGVTEEPSAGEPSIGVTEEPSAEEPSIGVIEKPFRESEDPAEGQTTSRKMDVPNDKVGVLIGKGGDTIRYLQYNSGAKIQITRDADSDPRSATRPVEIIGTISSINQAEKLIHAVIAEADAGGSPSLVARGIPTSQADVVGDQLEMQVPNEKVGLIIGRGGDTIKSLQAKSGARIQLIPQHLPEGDGSKERTVRVTGDEKQIEMAREMIKDVMNQTVKPSSLSSGFNQQQSYRPRGPAGAAQWGPRGSHLSQPVPYNYQQRGPHASQHSQYPPPSYGGYPQQMAPRSNFGSGWQQRPHSGGYDYYRGQGGHMPDHPVSAPISTPTLGHGPGPSPAMGQTPSQANYNYGQPHGPDYGHQAYSQTVPPQQGYEHGYDAPKYDNHATTHNPYGHGSSQPVYAQTGNQPDYGAQHYGKPPYGMPTQGPPPQSYGPPRTSQPGDIPYQGPVQPSQAYGSNVPPLQQYPYASSGPVQQAYPTYVSASANDGYNQAPPVSGTGYPQQGGQPVPGYSQPGGQQATGYVQGAVGYGSYPSTQQGYSEQPAANNAAYGYPGSQDPAYGGAAGTAYPPPNSQQGYAQPAPTQPSYDQSVPQSGGYGATPASASVGHGKTVSPQPAYPQYDSTQIYSAPR